MGKEKEKGGWNNTTNKTKQNKTNRLQTRACEIKTFGARVCLGTFLIVKRKKTSIRVPDHRSAWLMQ